MQLESRLIPILREGVDVVKMIFFKKLKTHLTQKYPARELEYINRLAGAILNDVFGTPNSSEPFASFWQQNQEAIKQELFTVASTFAEMRIPLTDALRVQFLCDHQEGVDSAATLAHAKTLKILLADREVPLPANFLNLARSLGAAFDFLVGSKATPKKTLLH
jgi:hypothetical protein